MNPWRLRVSVAMMVALGAIAVGSAPGAPPRGNAPADSRAVRREIEALYGKFARATRENDRYAMQRLLANQTTEDFVVKMSGGKKMEREDAIAAVEEGPMAAAQFTDYQFHIVQLSLKGEQATVVFNDRTVALIPDQRGNTHKMVATSTTRDTWVKTSEGWRMKLSEELKSSTLVDGKPVRQK